MKFIFDNICDNIYSNMVNTIDKTCKNSPEDAVLLKELFKNLIEYNKNKLNKLSENIAQDISQINHPTENMGEIYTALVNNYIKEPFFFPVKLPEINSVNISISETSRYAKEDPYFPDFIGVFFKSSYEDFIRITDSYNNCLYNYKVELKLKNTGKIQTNHCRFLRNHTFIDCEQLLKNVADQYGCDHPLIYSPYARRFAEIQFLDPVETNNIDKIIFGNDIAPYIEATTLEKQLVWNININQSPCDALDNEIEDNDKLSGKTSNNNYVPNEFIIPDFKPESYTYKYIYKCNSNEYILFDGTGKSKLEIARKREDKRLLIFCDSISKPSPLLKLTVIKPDCNNLEKLDQNQIFQNFYLPALLKKHRLISFADVCYIVNGFNKNKYGIVIDTDNIKFYSPANIGSEENLIADYNTLDRYYDHGIPYEKPCRTIKIGSKNICVLIFYKTEFFNGNIYFIEDYARYVLSYLNEKFPEFNWKGKKGWNS